MSELRLDFERISEIFRLIKESETEASLFAFHAGQNVEKIGGSYQATGIIMARFLADDGSPRYVFRFDSPAGLLHIFNERQLKAIP